MEVPTLVLAGIGATFVVGWQVISTLFGIPGAEETLQDMFTANFVNPDVPDPWSRLLELNRSFWPLQLNTWLNLGAPFAASTFLAVVVAGLGALCWAARFRYVVLWLAVGATGVLSVAFHPVGSEVDRLIALVWLPVAVG